MLFAFTIDLLCTIAVVGIVAIGIFLLVAFAILAIGEKHDWW